MASLFQTLCVLPRKEKGQLDNLSNQPRRANHWHSYLAMLVGKWLFCQYYAAVAANNSATVQTWSVSPAAIAGVIPRSVRCRRQKL